MSEPEFNHSTENWSFYAQKITSPTHPSGISSGNLTVTATKNIILNSNNVIIGRNAGLTNQGTNAIAIGFNAGNSGQGTNAVAIGVQAGYTNQGSGAIAIGYQAGQTNQATNSIVINASGSGFSATQSSFYVAPIRNCTQSTTLGYDATNKEITYYNQNAVSSPSGLPTTITATASATLSINFNNSFTSVTNYPVSSTNNTTASVITINNYQFTNAVVGAQYTIGITLTNNGTSTTQWVFNGQTGPPTTNVALKTNFADISTTAFSSGNIKYLVLTIAYDGSYYYMAGSLFA
jgi:hypothetical protein